MYCKSAVVTISTLRYPWIRVTLIECIRINSTYTSNVKWTRYTSN